jgi:hypothetical protein
MFHLSKLTPEDRELYDDTMFDAVMDADGTARPTQEIGRRLYDAMINLSGRGYEWAEEFISSCAISEAAKRAKTWAKDQRVIETPDGDKLVSRSGYVAAKRRDRTGAKNVDQLVLWETATLPDIEQVIRRDAQMINGLKIEMSTARFLRDLMIRTRTTVVSDGLAAEGWSDLNSYLSSQAS